MEKSKMADMSSVIVPKSDQLNSDDLIAGPITIKITGVSIKSGEQPVAISYEGDNGKPYKCCKSMARIMVAAWGADASKYVGRSLTLFRDPKVKWAGLEVGGIRISHMSHISDDMTMALTVTRQNRKPYTVKPLPTTTTAAASQPSLPAGPEQASNAGAGAPTITDEQARNLLSYCEQTGVNISRVLLKVKVDAVDKIPAAMYQRCIDFIDAAAKK